MGVPVDSLKESRTAGKYGQNNEWPLHRLGVRPVSLPGSHVQQAVVCLRDVRGPLWLKDHMGATVIPGENSERVGQPRRKPGLLQGVTSSPRSQD